MAMQWLCFSEVTLTLLFAFAVGHGARGECNEALGLESGHVKDEQVTSSDTVRGKYRPITARLNNRYGWTWGEDEYIKIDFLRLVDITQLAIQGAGGLSITRLWLFYSVDGYVWQTYTDRGGAKDIDISPRSWREIVNLTLDTMIKARYIAISPRSFRPGLRLEVFGCNSTSVTKPPTFVDHDIYGNMVWIPLNNPYVVASRVTVKPSSTLVIQPGVKIIFTSIESGMIIQGTVNASGIEGLPVSFWSNFVPYKAISRWEGVTVQSTGRLYCTNCEFRRAKNAITGSPDSLSLRNVRFSINDNDINFNKGSSKTNTFEGIHSKDNMETAIVFSENIETRSRVVIINSTFEGTRNALLLQSPCELEIHGSSISHAKSIGIAVEAESSVIINESTLKSSHVAIWQSAAVNMTIRSSEVLDNYEGLILHKGSITSVSHTKFENQKRWGIGSGGEYEGTLQVTSSMFHSNQYGINMDVTRNRIRSRVVVINSTFQGSKYGDVIINCESININFESNVFNGSAAGFPLRISSTVVWFDTDITIEDNEVRNYGQEIKIIAWGKYDYENSIMMVNVLRNTFENLTSDYALNLDIGSETIMNNTFINSGHHATLNVTGTNSTIQGNIFENPTSTYDLVTMCPYRPGHSIDARYNFFGSSEARYVSSRVYGVLHNMTLTDIILNPYYISKSLDAQVSNAGMFSQDNVLEVGGVLHGDVMIPGNKKLVITKTIIVPSGHTLTIGSNVTLIFIEDRGIIVRGTLKSLGKEDARVYMKNGQQSQWGGIVVENGDISLAFTNIQAARSFGSNSHMTCYDHLSINISHSFINVSILNLRALNLSLEISESAIVAVNQTYASSKCQDNYVNASSRFMIHRSEFVADDINIFTNTSDTSRQFVTVTNSSFNGTGRNTSNKDVTFDFNKDVAANVLISGNAFTYRNLIITAESPLKKDVHVEWNSLNASWITIKIQSVMITHNAFENTTGFALKALIEGHKDFTINGTYNFWGSSEYHKILAKVYDKMNRLELPLVKLVPFYKDPLFKEVVSSDSFVGPNNTIGGSVYGSVKLKSRETYTVVSSIYVGPRHALTIGPGVVLLFDKDTGLTVEGNLTVKGKAEMPVLLRAHHPGTPWDGLFIKSNNDRIRFTGGTDRREGIVEVHTGSTFSTVCGAAFDVLDAKVVCRMAGFNPSGGVDIFISNEREEKFGSVRGWDDVFYYNMNCTGDETHLDDCPREPYREPNCFECSFCPHYEDIGVRCLGKELPGSFSQHISLEYLELNDTRSGLVIEAPLTRAANIKSKYSLKHGISILSVSFMNETTFEYIEASDSKGDGIYLQGKDKFRTVTFNGCSASNNKGNGITLAGYNSLQVHGCTLRNNTAGILAGNFFTNLTISNSQIVSNRKNAIKASIDRFEMFLTVTGSNITGHFLPFYSYGWDRVEPNVVELSWHEGHVLFEGNNFRNNSGNCIVSYGVSIEIIRNSFTNNSGMTFDLLGHYDEPSRMNLSSNTISSNEQPHEDYLIQIRISEADSILEFTENEITNNSAEKLIFIGNIYSSFAANVRVLNNSILRNKVQRSLLLHIYGIRLHNNSIVNPGSLYELTMPHFEAHLENDASHNYWGFNQTGDILGRISSFDNDMNLGFVKYLPALISKLPYTVGAEKHTDLNLTGSFGGVIEGTVVLGDAFYVIDRSIMIRSHGKLILKGGTTVSFLKNRGVYSYGSMEIKQLKKDVILVNQTDEAWHGVVVNQTTGLHLFNLTLSNSASGLVLDVENVTIHNCSIRNTLSSGMTLHQNVRKIDMEGSEIYNSNEHGIHVYSHNIILQHGRVYNNTENGVFFEDSTKTRTVKNMVLHSNGINGLHFRLSDRQKEVNTTIIGCHIYDHRENSAVRISSWNDVDCDVNVLINKCKFEDNMEGSVDIFMETWSDGHRRSIEINKNLFIGSGSISIDSEGLNTIDVRDNLIQDLTSSSDCFLTVKFDKDDDDVNGNQILNVVSNKMKNVTANCGYSFKSSSTTHGGFLLNDISDSTFQESSLKIKLKNFTIFQNFFNNPGSNLELQIISIGTGSLNATNNWWGTVDMSQVQKKIIDKSDDSSLLTALVLPIMKSPTFDCSLVKNCSGQGSCIRPNFCHCDTGWKGTFCEVYDCSDLSDCNQGTCVGPNQCDCNIGWIGDSCMMATCYGVNNCSGNGFCAEPDTCTCIESFTGPSCDACSPYRWGPVCLPCPLCQHGTCSKQTGECICESPNWNGTLCNECSKTFYGPECLAIPTVLRVSPNAGVDTGGTLVHVRGDNFNGSGTDQYKCRFGSIKVNASRVSNHHITCVSPKLSPRAVSVDISVDGGQSFTNNKIKYLFVARCEVSTCGSSFTPPHGRCVFGRCSCSLPWTGPTCSLEIITPVLETVPNTTLLEGEEYRENLNLTQGTHVVRWTFQESPEGMLIDEESGDIIWKEAVGNTAPYLIKVRAENPAGYDVISWSLTVTPAYSVVIDDVYPSGVLPNPREIFVSGHLDVMENANLTSAKVKLIVQNNGQVRELTTSVDLTVPLPMFKSTFIPRPHDVGTFSISGNHPSDDIFVSQASWSVKGMICKPKDIFLSAYLEDSTISFQNVSFLTNIGVDSIDNITVTMKSYSFNVESAEVKFPSREGKSNLSLLKPHASVSFDLEIKQSFPLKTDLYIVFRSQQGTRTVLRVHLDLKIRSPVFQMSPSSLSKHVIRGKQNFFNIDITNNGEAEAKNVSVEIPDYIDIEVASFSSGAPLVPGTTQEIDTEVEDNLDQAPIINVGETATLVLVYTVPPEKPFGKVNGKIGIFADDVQSFLPFTFFITSDEKYDISVNVEDEYTYFAKDNPLLEDAKVTLRNPRLGLKKLLVTDETGSVLFKDLSPEQYSIQVEADNHTTESIVIVVDGSKSTYSVFLQRSAITYSWSVTKTMFEDKYEIKLETTFETQVPMPNVVITPSKVNIFPYLEGQLTTLQFLITNHGFIRANKVRFDLPNHPKLSFTQLVDDIGDLDANSSIVVPFNVSRRTMPKRSAGGCNILLLYNYVCGTERTKETGVALTNEPPDEPPSPCGSELFRRFWLRGVPFGGPAWAVSGLFTSTTQLCDCVDAYVDGCLISALRLPLEVMKGVGCLVDIYDLIQLDADSSDVAVATTLAATAIDCAMLTCPACPYIFKALNCLDGLISACKPKNGKGSNTNSGSETVKEILKAKENIKNYVDTTKELLGDRAVADVKGDWKDKFLDQIAEGSDDGYLLTKTEVTNIMSSLPSGDVTIISGFLIRWNNTFSAWKNGSVLPEDANAINLPLFRRLSNIFLDNTRDVKKRGFSTIFQHFEHTISEYKVRAKEKDKKQGVCGRVTIQIKKDLVLTREAFLARLELENGEGSPLEEIKVDIFISKTLGNGSSDRHLFSIGDPELEGISDVTGSGSVDAGIEASAEWLIIPREGAAVLEDTSYDVGGELSYVHNGVLVSVPLLPDTITVSPNPSLSLAYFHEKYVQGDDPFTESVEKSVPFSLSVMVTNKGEGVAHDVKITSGQPEIIDNEKGLLVAFKIISAQLGVAPLRPSLTVDFGDISAKETKIARWFMTSSLKGTFFNYSATFENINPLGDPELSVFSSITYHETIHLVRIDDPVDDDELDDFLVNDAKDATNLPDRLYDSSDGFISSEVDTVSPVTFYREDEGALRGSKRYIVIQISIAYDGVNWRYTRIINNLTSNSESESLLQVTRDDGRDIRVPQNAWLTTHYDDEFYFHLFDKRSDGATESVYTVIFGKENIYPPSFTNESYTVELEPPITQDVVKVEAIDFDGDEISYRLVGNGTLFSVGEDTGVIKIVAPLHDNKTHLLSIIAVDSGHPPKSSSVFVTIVVKSSGKATTTATGASSANRSSELTVMTFFVLIISLVMKWKYF